MATEERAAELIEVCVKSNGAQFALEGNKNKNKYRNSIAFRLGDDKMKASKP